MKKIYFIIAAVCLSYQLKAQIYVTQNGLGNKDGSSWSDAYEGTKLQQAINEAEAAAVKEVWVAKGTYTPTENLTGTADVDKSFILRNGVKIYGGFAGGEASINDRTAISTTNETILSGDFGGGINAHHVVVNIANVSGVMLDGFTITGGKANGTGNAVGSVARNNGGGMFLAIGSSAEFSNLLIKDNSASNFGGGIYLTYSGTEIIEFENVNFTSNTASVRAGAIYPTRSSGTASVEINNSNFNGNGTALGGTIFNDGQLKITNSVLKNSSGSSGGAINNNSGATLNITGSTFLSNQSTGVGAGIYVYGGTVSIENTTFESNNSSTNGGAINQNAGTLNVKSVTLRNNNAANGAGIYTFAGTITIENSIFESNSTTARGAGIYLNNGILTISGSSFNTNNATSDGGAIYRYGGSAMDINKCIFKNNISGVDAGAVKAIFGTTKINNSVFYNNSAQEGGAVYVGNTAGASAAVLIATNNTFYKNKDVNKAGVVSFLNTAGRADIKLYNNILVDNTSTNGSADIRMTTLETPTAALNIPIVVENNLLQSTLISEGKLSVVNSTVYNSALPLFVSITETDLNFLHLVEGQATQKGSSVLATNAGLLPGTDLADNNREQHSIIDLGAYEYQGVLPVTFDYFKVKKEGATANLSWRTLAENNSSHFMVQRGSSPSNFVDIKRIEANGNTNEPKAYGYIDQNPLAGINYYRLVQYDYNGDHEVLGEQALTFTLKGSQNLVYPNPASKYVSVKLPNVSGIATIDLVNLTGQNVISKDYSISASGEITIDLSGVSAGTYVLWINKGKTNNDKKLLVVK